MHIEYRPWHKYFFYFEGEKAPWWKRWLRRKVTLYEVWCDETGAILFESFNKKEAEQFIKDESEKS